MQSEDLFSSVNNPETVVLEAESFHENKKYEKVVFSGQFLDKIEFYNCTFLFCDFTKAKLSRCEFEKCTFISCDLSLLNFGGSGLSDVKFTKSKLIGILWESVRNPYRYSFEECKLDNSSFYGLNLRNLVIKGCSARDADFTRSDLTKAIFSDTDLLNSRFSNTNLSFADLSSALYYNIDPSNNKIKKAIFSYPEVTSLLNSFDIIIKD
jgi:fluoroquinolone resistance protein